ncbi:MAG: UDP-N-acetylglucosamine 2-epimerase (non-hydrolyzing) [Methanomassiliicoccales archaeon]|nr:MAG: UDP-N-acetylglucosamine 2-epimerase (non-hydrolyzing) [Methanomassiliicoccales archaeon]
MNPQRKISKLSRAIKVLHVVGARPNFVKVAPLMREMSKYKQKFEQKLVHTGQHYDEEMSKLFFDDLGLNEPDIYLGVGSGTHAEQTGKIMIEFEKVCLEEKPDLVIVAGDVNSTIACALVAVKLHIPVAHVEAGLRSFDKTMPEEINRLLTDQITDYLFTTCKDANQNLIKEGITRDKIFFVGNTMIDTLLQQAEIAKKSMILENLGLRDNDNLKRYAVVTLHRPSNVDNPTVLEGILTALNELAKEIPVIFPAHPRTIKQIRNFKLQEMINYEENSKAVGVKKASRKIFAIPPLGYLDFLRLMSEASVVLTDSGGIQEETTILGIPCLTLRANTERPITTTAGTNSLVGNDSQEILGRALDVLKNRIQRKKIPKHWDGKAAVRIARVLRKKAKAGF